MLNIINNRIKELPNCDLKNEFEDLKKYIGLIDNSIIKKILEKNSVDIVFYLKQLIMLDIVKNNKEILEILFLQDDPEVLSHLRYVLKNEFIINNKKILYIFLNQKYPEEIEVLYKSLKFEIIKNNLNYFYMIVSQGNYNSQYQMMLAILNEDIRNNEILINIIDNYKNNPGMQEQARLNLEIKKVRENMELFRTLMNIENYCEQEKRREKIRKNIANK